MRALSDTTPTCIRCKERADKRKLYLSHFTLIDGTHDVCLCEKCFYLLPVDFAKKVRRASDAHESSLDFNKMFISAFKDAGRKRSLDLNCHFVIVYSGTEWLHARYENFKKEREFAKGIQRAMKAKEPIYSLYNNGKVMADKEVETLLKKYKSKEMIG